MNIQLQKRNAIYGFCAVWIMLFHLYRRIGMPCIPVLTHVTGIGNMAVDVFFFCSGFCLSLSAKKNEYPRKGWRVYFHRRMKRVLIPYLIICTPYYLWSALSESSSGPAHKGMVFLANLSSVSFWTKGKETTWFVYGILFFYLLFPAFYSFAEKNGWKKKAAFIAGQGLLSVLFSYLPVLRNSVIVWARLPIFTFGVFLGTEEKKGKGLPTKTETLLAVLTIVVFGSVISFSETSDQLSIPDVYRYILYFPMAVAFLIVSEKIKTKGFFFERIGSISLEIYLTHIVLLNVLRAYGVYEILRYWLYLIVPSGAVLISLLVQSTERRLMGKRMHKGSLQ